jgi:hypothetical protein
MQGTGNRSRFAGALVGFAIFLAVVVTAVAAPPKAEHLPPHLGFEIAPSDLSRTAPTPVWTEITGGYRTDDGSHVPPTKELRLQADRHLVLDLKGVPGCRRPSLDVRRSPGEIEDLCRKSIVGRGEVSFEVEFPDQPRSKAEGRMVLFKASESATIDLVAHMFLSAPVTAQIVVPVEIRRVSRARIGWEALLPLPKIAGGYGSLTDYSLRISRRFLSATCVGGKLELRSATTFADGTRRHDRVVHPCTVAKADDRK